MSAPVIVASGLARWYGDVIGLNDVSVEIEPGITGLLGLNGAGKSSFLRIAAGELKPSLGTIRVLGLNPFANPRLHRRIGYCPEGERFFDRLRAREFVTHLLRMAGYDARAARSRALTALEEVGMGGASEVRLGACSKGMRQRVKLAQAIAHEPELLLLDEPLGGLDPLARRETRDLIRKRAAEGVSVLISSHVLHEVESLTNQVLLINQGRIAATGEVAEIRALMDQHPHRIRLETTERRALAALLVSRDGMKSVRFEESGILVETSDPAGLYGALPAIVVENGIPVTGISSPDDRLEAVFDILVHGGNG